MSAEVGRILAETAKRDGLKYFLVSFLDLFGVQRAKLVPAAAIAEVCKNGAGFAGFASHFALTPANADVLAVPDPASLIRLPWKPEVGWLASDLYMSGKPFEQSPRRVLQKQLARAADLGYILKTGVEVEFMLLQPLGVGAGGAPDAAPRLDPRDAYHKPCYEQSALMRQYDVLAEICGYCEQLGWEPYQMDHEDASSQFEVNWKYAEAQLTADRVAFYKFMVRAVAERHGLRVTFMPKPLESKTGNGQHMHLTLHSTGGVEANVFADKASADPMGLSAIAHTFLGGMMTHVRGLCAFACPTVNSYKRLGAAAPDSGATWAPTVASHGGNDRTHVVRVPDAPRFEFRLADMATNPYLLPAATLAAGLHGMEANLQPGPRASVAAWKLPRGEAQLLPTNLLEAIEALEQDRVLTEALGAEMCLGYAQLRRKEWRDYSMHLTQWELDTYLDL